MGVDYESDFNWWVPHSLKKHDAIVALVKKCSSKYLKLAHKLSIECPKTMEDALELDKQNDHTIWADTMLRK